MVIIQMVLKIKTSFLYFIKKLFNLSVSKLLIFLSFFLFSCSTYLIQAEEVKLENLKCGSNSEVTFFENNGLFVLKNKNFNYKLNLIDKNLNKNDFNLIYISKPQGSGGYTLEVENIIKKKDKHLIYFKENKPPPGSTNITAITATYCFMKISSLDKVEIFVK